MARKLKTQAYIKLQEIADEIIVENPDWNIVDKNFSYQKKLFDYQEEALNNAIKVLWKYFEDLHENKEEFAKYYGDLDIADDLNISLKDNNYAHLLKEYFKTQTNGKGNEYIPFSEIVNSMSFWMATGSGKTVVIIKLIELLHKLMNQKLLPKREILFLTYRDDLVKSFKKLVDEYNYEKALNEQIKLVNLKEYEKEKFQLDFGNRIFYYRSDLISDERKENILNYRDYLENIDERYIGNWYLLLDEAHKGDKQDSKRQSIFSILSQNGFLFNFSATFTQAIDIVTTVYNFNLDQFIKSGYGKQIYVSQEEIKAFQQKSDFNEKEKRKIILKTLINLSLVKKAYENIKEENLYHNPLLIYLMNSVNTENADLKLVFKEIANIGKNIDKKTFEATKKEIIEELNNAKYTIGDESYTLNFAKDFIENIKEKDIYKFVYNSENSGNIEYIINPKNKQEIALKLDSSDKPFALIKIGDISKWIKENLTEYKENETFREEGYFETLNDKNSPINLLLGSRAFYEGWDSNRPNVISFINIGKGEEAKKFVLQAIGRGVRIEPLPNQRKRLDRLSINNEELEKLKELYKNETKILETLFIYATNKKAVETILKELELVKKSIGFEEVSLWKNKEKIEEIKPDELLIPSYKTLDKEIVDLPEEKIIKFRMSKANLELLRLYFQLMPIERFLLEYENNFKVYKNLKRIVQEDSKYIKIDESKNFKNVSILIKSLITYLNIKLENYDEFIPVDDKIVHFKKIKVRSDLKNDFIKIAKDVKDAIEINPKELYKKVSKGEITEREFEDLLNKKDELLKEFKEVKLQKLMQHYYIPMVYAKDKVDWIKHIINVESEYEFIQDLLSKLDDLDKYYDWWMFSKLDEHLDKEIYIPYSSDGKVRKFIPDFIFWFKKENKYTICFIDPKGGAYSSYLEKVDGYKSIFEENGKIKTFIVNGLEIEVILKLYTDDVSLIPGDEYKKYWMDKNNFFKLKSLK
ncbi:adenine-specific DNA-methyltransferase [Nitratiruptor sp. YY08-26]|uniref:DEAD/DEAH box helicase family protein n=1 Tax=unclassified Nitratiruptor TaxID=2624044 RepID=UPI0019152C60|nr:MULTISPECIES: DEAD/DEAH box helicase family protein [unclassified Nitratiruptor]BCD62900.1 adenine-specific DNA-methyltransferase [Nitratiruptor sp. YY08-13]BCD66835.1 adenine-specific DNA-methyltransferase [Nitratiruptor sp. YY08-26]